MRTASRRNHRAIHLLLLCLLASSACSLPSYSIDLGTLGRFKINLGGSTTETQAAMPPDVPAPQETATVASAAVQQVSGRDDCLAGVFIGASNSNDVQAVLGAPVGYLEQDGAEILFYPTGRQQQYTTIILSEGVVQSVSVLSQEGDPAWSVLKAQLGEPAVTAFSDYDHGSRIFAYPMQGISITAGEDLDVVYSRTCFIPMTVEAFTAQYDGSLLSEDPFFQ